MPGSKRKPLVYPAAMAHFERCQRSLKACAEAFGNDTHTLTVFESYDDASINDHDPRSIESALALAHMQQGQVSDALDRGDADEFALHLARLAGLVGFLSALVRKKDEHDRHARVAEGYKNRALAQLKARFQAWLRQRVDGGLVVSTIDEVLEQPDLPGGRAAYKNKDTARAWCADIYPGMLRPGRPRK